MSRQLAQLTPGEVDQDRLLLGGRKLPGLVEAHPPDDPVDLLLLALGLGGIGRAGLDLGLAPPRPVSPAGLRPGRAG